MNQREKTIDCPECGEEVELCISCGEIVHDDDPKALTGGGIYCGFCHKRKFLEGCTNRKTAQDIDGHPV
jgi:DNA-directed RNA polymerase subunit RPC12/RpoP